METKEFIRNYREAFGSKAPLPLLFGYSDKPIAENTMVSANRLGGCFFKGLQSARDGQLVSLSKIIKNVLIFFHSVNCFVKY